MHFIDGNKKEKKKNDLRKLQFKAEQCKQGKMTRVEMTPSGMWSLWKKEGEILPLSVKLILQYQRGHFILAGSCWLLIRAASCAIIVSDNNVQSTIWRQIL